MALCLLVLFGFVAVQASAVIDDYLHDHGDANHNNCPLCQNGHIPLLPALAAVELTALAVAAWQHLPNESAPVSSGPLAFHPSRAPPVLSSIA